MRNNQLCSVTPTAGPGLRRFACNADHRSDNGAKGELDGDDRHNATAATTVPGQAASDDDDDDHGSVSELRATTKAQLSTNDCNDMECSS